MYVEYGPYEATAWARSAGDLVVGSSQQKIEGARRRATEILRDFAASAEGSATLSATIDKLFPGYDRQLISAELGRLAMDVWPTILILPAVDLPGGLAGYDAETRTILVSQRLIDIDDADGGILASVLIEEAGHHLDAIGGGDTPGDEGAAFRALVASNGLYVAPLGGEEGLGYAVIDGRSRLVELASISDSGGFEGSQRQVALESTGDNKVSWNFQFYTIPDRFIIRYEGKTLVDTGFVSGARSGTFELDRGKSNAIDVFVATADSGTAWDYSVSTVESGECPDTTPLAVVATSGKFEDLDNNDTCEIENGTVVVGRSDGNASLLRLVGGRVERTKTDLIVTNATVFAASSGDQLFTGSFKVPYASGQATGLNVTDIYKIGGLDTDLDGFVIMQNEVRLNASFEMPDQVTGLAVNGAAVSSDVLVVDSSGLRFGGPSGKLVLPFGGQYTLADIIKVTSTNHTISYDSPQDLIKYQGKLTAEAPIRGVDSKITLDLSGQNFVQIQNGQWDVKGTLKFETDVDLKLVTFKGFELGIDTTTTPDTVYGVGSFEFPFKARTPELDLKLGFTLAPLEINTIGLKFEDLNIPVGRPDVFLQRAEILVDKLSPKVSDPVTVTGGVGLTYGPQLTIGEIGGFDFGKVSLARLDGDVTINADSLSGKTQIAILGESIFKQSGTGTLNWKDGFLQGSGDVTYLAGLGGGVAFGNAALKVDTGFNVSTFGNATVKMPELGILGPFGGVSLGSGTAMLTFTHDGNLSNDFAAAWGFLALPLPNTPNVLVGVRVEFDGDIELIGQNNIPPASSFASFAALGAGGDDGGFSALAAPASQTYDVPADQPYILLVLQWDGDPSLDPDIVITTPDGVDFAEADFPAHIVDAPGLAKPGQVVIAIGPEDGQTSVQAGTWGIAASNAADLGNVTTEATMPTPAGPDIELTGATATAAGYDIDYQVEPLPADGDAEVTLYYDSDATDFDGTAFASGLAVAQVSQTYSWDTSSLAPGDYYVYGSVMTPDGTPAFDYFENKITVAGAADLVVTTTLKDVQRDTTKAGGTTITYDVVVENKGTAVAKNVSVSETFDVVGRDDDSGYLTQRVNGSSATNISSQEAVTYTVGDLAVGASQTFTVALQSEFSSPPLGGVDLTHELLASTTSYDLDVTDNSDFGSVRFFSGALEPAFVNEYSDLSVELVVANPGANVGDVADYKLKVSNIGPDGATGVVLREFVTGLQDYSIRVDGTLVRSGANTASNTLQIGALASGGSKVVEVSGRVANVGQTISTSQLSSPTVSDPDSANNSLTQYRNATGAAVAGADVSLTGSASTTTPAAGDTISFTVTFVNSGPNVASGIRVGFVASPGIVFLSGSGAQGTFDPATGIWDVGNLNPNIARTFTVQARVDNAASQFVYAEVVGLNEPDPDSTIGNVVPTEDDYVALLGTAPSPPTGGGGDGPSDGNGPIFGSGADRHVDGDASSLLVALEGDDTVIAGAGDDTVSGNLGNDVISGNQGADSIDGGQGDDRLFGGQGNDRLFGNEGDDTLFGNLGNDILAGNQGSDTIAGGQGDDTLYGGQGSDKLLGGQGDDQVFGNLGDDLVSGNLGNDLVNGGQGNDTLYGGQGNDTLVGGLGNDLLFGNLGADRFVFGTGSGADRVGGFSQASGDRLDLQGQTYTVATGADGSAVLALSGGGTVTLTGVTPGAVGPGFFV